MPRTKQAQIELPEEAENIAASVVSSPDPASIPTKRVKNFLRQEWEEEVPATPPATQHSPDLGNVVAIVEEEGDVYDFPETPLEGLLRKLGNSSDRYSVTVWELPNYGKDGNASPSARRKLCGTIPIPSSLEDLEEFCTLIQEQFALSGKDLYYFLPIVRKNNRIEQCDLGVLEIRGLAVEKTVPADPRPEMRIPGKMNIESG